ncbi:hypothetical protein B4143_0922 [Bacillus subtilis]|nr:hypothetical protein B4143_0922 [Bacillus subtilis]RPK10617.1 hypothetical protein EH5_03455 [Bacillus subtilis]
MLYLHYENVCLFIIYKAADLRKSNGQTQLDKVFKKSCSSFIVSVSP